MPRILIVDDERNIRSLLAKVFGNAGYAVWTASDAQEAILYCESQGFEVILSDIRMGSGLNGHDLARWIVRRFPQTKVILMTGSGMDCENCPIAAKCPMIAKPFSIQEVLAKVRSVLG